MTENKSYNNGIYTVFLSAFLVLFQIGIYFVYIPWNAERLQITEALKAKNETVSPFLIPIFVRALANLTHLLYISLHDTCWKFTKI